MATKMKALIAAAALMVLGLAATPCQAVFIVNNWTLDLAGTGEGTLAGEISGIDRITYTGVAHTEGFDANGNNVLDAGEDSIIDGLLVTTGFRTPTVTVATDAGEVLNSRWELTFDFTVPARSTGFAFPTQNFTHLGGGAIVGGTPVDGLLDWYVNDLAVGGAVQANPGIDDAGGGAGFTDGTLIATFEIIPGGGGSFNVTTLDGSDDATFKLLSALPNVFFDSAGNDLGLLVAGGEEVLLTLTDSNFDGDPDNDGMLDSGPPGAWPFPRDTQDPVSFFADEDGSAVFAIVPEPSSMALLAVGVLSIAGAGYRRRRSK